MTEPVSDIRYLERNEIDTVKWDKCILSAPNGLDLCQVLLSGCNGRKLVRSRGRRLSVCYAAYLE